MVIAGEAIGSLFVLYDHVAFASGLETIGHAFVIETEHDLVIALERDGEFVVLISHRTAFIEGRCNDMIAFGTRNLRHFGTVSAQHFTTLERHRNG